jgi:hypothetical protein
MISLVEKRKLAYYKVLYFWKTYGNGLPSDTFKDDFVEKMRQLNQDIEEGKSNTRRYLVFWKNKENISYSLIDEFNDYLGALRLLDLMLRR